MTLIAILGEDHVVGRALELLLQGAGYGARFVTEASFDDKPDLLDGVGLLLFTAGLSTEQREAYATCVESTPSAAGVPILELISSSDGEQGGKRDLIPWPCRMEELKRRIEAALLSGSRREVKEASGG
jgi:hypothetical protein